MKNRQGVKTTTQSGSQTIPFPEGPPEPRLLLAHYKERLEALIHDERFEEAGNLNQKIQTLKDTLKSNQNLKPEKPSLIDKFLHFI